MINSWIEAARPRTLPLALSSTLLGSFLAWHDQPFKVSVLLLAMLTTLFLQVLSNLANDYGDSVNGMDNAQRVGPDRAVQSGAIGLKAMRKGVIVTAVLALISGIFLIAYGFNFKMTAGGVLFFILGLAALGAAIKYTVGKNPYGYIGLGDLFVYLFFGLTGVLGTYFLHTGTFKLPLLLPASAVGLLSTAVLNLNNMRDAKGDEVSGKRTLVVIMGINYARYYHLLLIISAWLCLLVYTLMNYEQLLQLIFGVTLPFFVIHLKKIFTTTPASLDPQMRVLSLSTFATVMLFGIGMMW